MRRSGFTLVELSMSLLIGGIVVVLALQMLWTFSDLRVRAEGEHGRSIEVASVRGALGEWLRRADLGQLDRRWVFTGIRRTALDGRADDALVFTADGARDAGSIRRMILVLDRDPETPAAGLVLLVRDALPSTRTAVELLKAAESVPADWTVMQLVPTVRSLRMEYQTHRASGRWRPTWSSSTILPRAVRIRLTGSELPALLAEPITLSLPVSR